MLSRSRMRFSIKSEDETAKNQRILSEKIQLKKQQIRAEFESFEIKQTYGFLSPGELKFKKELDDIRAKKQSKLQKLTFLSNLLICKPDFNDPENKYSAQSLFSLNPDPEILREKLQSSILELKKVESNIESQVMNENSIKSKIEEFIRGINLFKRQNFEMRYLCNLSEKRFKYLDVIRFNAKTKEVI